PDLVAGGELGGHADERRVEVLDAAIPELGVEQFHQLVAREQAAAAEIDIEQAEDLATSEAAGEGFQVVEESGGVATADQRADRGADDDVRPDADLAEGLEDADVGPAACGAAAERQGDAAPRPRVGGRIDHGARHVIPVPE